MEEKIEHATITYDVEKLRAALATHLRNQLPADAWTWLEERASLVSKAGNIQQFVIGFSAMPRKTGKKPLTLSEAEQSALQVIRPGLTIRHWTIDRLSRVWLMLHLDTTDKEQYIATIENLFPTAEMNELVALYSALPLLAYPAAWRARCAEGIRNNIGDVLESIMCDNPYASENLDEPAWNQLVLKAIFTEKPIHRIVGLDARANQTLAHTLSDFAHERWAAHRPVPPMLWRCIGNFIDERIFPDIQRIAYSEVNAEREAAALACAQSNYKPARELVDKAVDLKAILDSGATWDKLAQ
ncbi:EboA domain-containing protein [Dawidia soli]|uniref:EboA domain-containing protein n=1 Tax=Dawidia soli TaxID=2782352 RepID=A0AAP2DAI5_9BACT|nr:EboA domain-containing protein [Dawidia soli]MBT1687045.1 EboA domain-containing protein [Dawidia soli]